MPDPIDVGDGWTAEPVDGDPFASPSQPPLSPTDRDLMIRTVAGEAGGEPPAGQAAVAHVILNRVADGGYGEGVSGVVTAPVKPGSAYRQFSAWNAPGMAESSRIARALAPSDPAYQRIGAIVDQAYSGAIPDPTNGATHYYAPRAMPGGRPPPWAAALAKANSVKIGNQVFVGGSTGPGQAMPSQIVGGPYDEGTSAT